MVPKLHQISRRTGVLGLAVATWMLTLTAMASLAGAQTCAPPSQPGPALDVPPAQLPASLACAGDLASREPVLLVPGTTLTPQEFAWSYEPALRARGVPYCAVTLPNHAMSDTQVSAEYVVYAIRQMHAARRGQINIIGHSQGGMLPRWALRFWPDTRPMVDDLVGLAPSNHGTPDAAPVCNTGMGCAPSIFQQSSEANFIKALNSHQETFPIRTSPPSPRWRAT